MRDTRFKARRARRNILEKLRVLRTDNAADIRLDAHVRELYSDIGPIQYNLGFSQGLRRLVLCYP